MQRIGGQYTVIDGNGNGVNAATVTVYDAVTLLPLANVYNAGGSLTAPASKSNPFTTDAVGRWEIALPDGRYNFEYSGGNIATYTDYNICVFDSTITYPSPQLGTVTSVAATVPTELAVANSPVTGAGTLAFTWASLSGTGAAGKFIGTPSGGGAGASAARLIALTDLPSFGPTASTIFGSATKAAVVTTNAQGIVTTLSETTITPAFSSITATPATMAGYGISNGVTILNSGPSTNTTVGNTTVETSLLQNGYNAIAPTAMGAGTTIRVVIMGFFTQITNTNTIQIRMKAGTQVLLDTTALAIPVFASAASSPFRMEIVWTGRVSDPSVGTGYGQMILTIPSTVISATPNAYVWPQPAVTTASSGINTASPGAIDVLLQWGTAYTTSTITVTNFTVFQEGSH